MSNGDTENMSTDMSSFGYADVKRLMMCAVSGADPRVRREYELMMQQSNYIKDFSRLLIQTITILVILSYPELS